MSHEISLRSMTFDSSESHHHLKTFSRIREALDANSETPADFLGMMNNWALESTGLIALDVRLGVLDNPDMSEIRQLIDQFHQASFDYDVLPSIWRYYKTPGFKKFLTTYEKINKIIMKYISEAVERFEKNPTPADQEAGVLEKLIKADRNIGIAMVEDMLFGGVGTTSASMTSVMYCLAKNMDKQEILRKEILTILPERDSKLTATSQNSIPYLRAVIKEAFRLKPITSGSLRAAGKDLVMQGYQVPKGVRRVRTICDHSFIDQISDGYNALQRPHVP